VVEFFQGLLGFGEKVVVSVSDTVVEHAVKLWVSLRNFFTFQVVAKIAPSTCDLCVCGTLGSISSLPASSSEDNHGNLQNGLAAPLLPFSRISKSSNVNSTVL
jgi:hypothetical protein